MVRLFLASLALAASAAQARPLAAPFNGTISVTPTDPSTATVEFKLSWTGVPGARRGSAAHFCNVPLPRTPMSTSSKPPLSARFQRPGGLTKRGAAPAALCARAVRALRLTALPPGADSNTDWIAAYCVGAAEPAFGPWQYTSVDSGYKARQRATAAASALTPLLPV